MVIFTNTKIKINVHCGAYLHHGRKEKKRLKIEKIWQFCFNIPPKKLDIFENLKISKKMKIWKSWTKSWQFSQIFVLQFFWKSENLETKVEICSQICFMKKSETFFATTFFLKIIFFLIMTKIFLIAISRNIYFEHSFDSKTHVCDIRRDLASWPIVQDYAKFWKISKNSSNKIISKNKIEIFFKRMLGNPAK